jgi:hypothetical protein
MTLTGKWRITEMDLWDGAAFELLGSDFFNVEGKRSGTFRFLAVEEWMDCRHGRRDGQPFVEFTWAGNDDCNPACGRGWAAVEADGALRGRIYFHQSDDSGFRAIRTVDGIKPHRNAGPEGVAERLAKLKPSGPPGRGHTLRGVPRGMLRVGRRIG